MKLAIRLGLAAITVLVLAAGYTWLGVRSGWFGELEHPGAPQGAEVERHVINVREKTQASAASLVNVAAPKQILFGDLHVHTTFSPDAFLWSLPMFSGEGPHPMSDACDYARHCSAIDFWAITDHAEASTPRKWAKTKQAIRQCNAVAGDPKNPDLVSFIGFEWTQVGRTPEEHYGHKNVIFEALEDDAVSARAIASEGAAIQALRNTQLLPPGVAFADWSQRQRYFDFKAFTNEIQDTPLCDAAVPSDQLPSACLEVAKNPGDLTGRLDAQGLDYLLIPHGTSWGFYTPPSTTFDKQLAADMRPETQSLIEVYSGHGNSEEHRPWRGVTAWKTNDKGQRLYQCPEPSDGYTPSCWRAGEIVAMRCAAEDDADPAACAERARNARNHAANMSVAYHLAVKGEQPEDWLDSGQCNDCFLPPFSHRPGVSVQYGLAISSFENGPQSPTRFHWGFIGSSDNHRARPGTGYKETDRRFTTDISGPPSAEWRERMHPQQPKTAVSQFMDQATLNRAAGFGLLEVERQNSFWMTGGLAAVHAEGRTREQIWDALKRRETYATSGPRILLWFDLVEGAPRTVMGGAVQTDQTPVFEVRAVGAFKQKPGCPDHAANGLPKERLQSLCGGECYHPSSERHPITRIEVIRIRPQIREGEPVTELIEDPWKTLDCAPSPNGCVARFSDPDYAASGRDATYYVRAIQAETKAINADPLNCERDADGACVKVSLCYADYRGGDDAVCLDPVEERAWSSPIYLSRAPAGGSGQAR